MRKFLIMSILASAALTAQATAADEQQRRPRGGGTPSDSSSDDSTNRPSRPAWVRGEGGMADDSPRPSRSERRSSRAEATADDGAQQSRQQPASRRRGGGASQVSSVDGGAQASTQASTQPAPKLSPFQQRLREHRAAQSAAAASGTPAKTLARTPGIAGGPRAGFLSGRVAAAPLGGKIQVASKPDKAWYAKWREHRQYNWQQHRERNRDHYHLGNYWDPYGYSYRRWQTGWMMWPSYYSDDYWLDDPYSWRLPPTYGPYRWVRYWDDALLVNRYTGQVVDVLYNVFW